MLSNNFFLIALVFILLIPSCKNKEDDSFDYDVRKTNLLGKWTIKQISQEIRADTVYAEYEINGAVDISFKADGTGFRKFSTFNIKFDWLYQYSPEKAIISDENPITLSLRNTTIYKIIKNEKDKQIWEYKVIDSTGVADFFKHTWEMSRK